MGGHVSHQPAAPDETSVRQASGASRHQGEGMPQRLRAGGRWRTFPGTLAMLCLLLSLGYETPEVSGQTPETLTGPGTFVRGIATIFLEGPEDQVSVVLEPATGAVTIEVLSGTATVTSGDIVIHMPTEAVVRLEELPETGAIRITVLAGPDVTVTSGGVTVVVPAGTGTTILPGAAPAPPALSVQPVAPPLPSVRSPVIGREVPLSSPQ